MRRRNDFPDNPKRIISDDAGDDIDEFEDVLYCASAEDFVSLYQRKTKEGHLTAVQQDTRADKVVYHDGVPQLITGMERTSAPCLEVGCASQAGLQDPAVCNKLAFNAENSYDSDEDRISDEEINMLHSLHPAPGDQKGYRCEIECDVDEQCKWSRIFHETHGLLDKNAGGSSHSFYTGGKDSQKGSKRNSKLRFSFHPPSYKEETICSPCGKLGNANDIRLDNLSKGSNSITELLEGLQEQHDSSQQPFYNGRKMARRRKQLLEKKILPTSSCGLEEIEYLLELPDDGISSEDEGVESLNECEPTSNYALTPMKSRTMADHFMEAFDFVPMYNTDKIMLNNKQRVSGYFGRLQQVMLGEKERQMRFLKQVEAGGTSKDEMQFFDVQIVSRSLEAKLTVCCCLLTGEMQISQNMNSLNDLVDHEETKNRTVVFNSRICDSVVLENGKLIRVYAPWVEVPVADGNIAFLCTYFSDPLTGVC